MKWAYVSLIVLCYAALCWLCWYRHRSRGRALAHVDDESGLLVAYASQTGHAAEVAQRTRQQLSEGNVPATAMPIDQLDEQLLRRHRRVLFVVSTYGEGEPPDMAKPFVARYLQRARHDLSHLRYGVLALGDRQYAQFCGFGHRLCQGLRTQAAQPLFDLIEVDGQDPAALLLWHQRVAALGGASERPINLLPAQGKAEVQRRVCTNKGSTGAPVYRLRLVPEQPMRWQAGDIATIAPGNSLIKVRKFLAAVGLNGGEWIEAADGAKPLEQVLTYRRLLDPGIELRQLQPLSLLEKLPPLPTRDYSIASIPEEGYVELLVRQVSDSEGELGLGSGWLTEYAPLHSELLLSIRSNPTFHAPDDATPLVLIGNGTGMAGLRAHLREREQRGAHQNWLIFGERNAPFDLHFADDITRWRSSGHLPQMDVAYSRDGNSNRYVQNVVSARASQLMSWLQRGAAIYVCGSRKGMAEGVEQSLSAIISDATVSELRKQGRYRRDVY